MPRRPRRPRRSETPPKKAAQQAHQAQQAQCSMYQQSGYMPQQQPPNSAPDYTGNGCPAQMGYPTQYPQHSPQNSPQYPPQHPQYHQQQMHPQHQQQPNMSLTQPMPRTYAPAANAGRINHVHPNMQMVQAVPRQYYVAVNDGCTVIQGPAGAELVGAVPIPPLRPMFQAEWDMIWSSVADVFRKMDERKAGKQRAVEPVDEPAEVLRFSSRGSLFN